MFKRYTLLLTVVLLTACNSNETTDNQTDETENTDSTQVESAKQTENPMDLVSKKDGKSLNEVQKEVQELLKACVNVDLATASTKIMYRGADESRLGKDHFNMANTREAGAIKVTCEVLREWLGESENYEFVSFSSDTTQTGIEHKVEVLFKKTKLGMERHFFMYTETEKGLLLFNMI